MMDVGNESAESSQWLLTDDLPCLDCEYNLRGLAGPIVQCPECGRHNDLRIPSQWSKKKLPLGVRERQHWPASAAALSLMLGLMVLLAIASGGEEGFILIAMIIAIGWAATCWQWMLSCYRIGWAVRILIALHFGAWSVLLGMGGSCMVMQMRSPLAYAVLIIVGVAAGLVAFWWVHREIKRGDAQARYRCDWKRWHVPVAEYDQREMWSES